MESPMRTPIEVDGQGTPFTAGRRTPESANWRTPVETPNPAWGIPYASVLTCGIYGHKQGQCGLEGTETVSDENPADGASTGNRRDADNHQGYEWVPIELS
nr:hypothetical protein Iba_chr10bCG9750 [Ipomoea batatas]